MAAANCQLKLRLQLQLGAGLPCQHFLWEMPFAVVFSPSEVYSKFIPDFFNKNRFQTLTMDSLRKLKLFPDSWYRNMQKREIQSSRNQIKSYGLMPTVDTSIKEV